jgi:hypothetical protein
MVEPFEILTQIDLFSNLSGIRMNGIQTFTVHILNAGKKGQEPKRKFSLCKK